MAWLTANIGTIAVVLVLVLIVALAIRSIFTKKKNGGCSCGCSDCPDCPNKCE